MLRRVSTYIKTEIKAIRNGKGLIFVACLTLSSFLWILNALEKRYTERVSIPVRYVNLPVNKDLTGKLPEKLDLTIEALGYTLLRLKLTPALSPILIDVNELSNNFLENSYISKYSFSTNGHKEEFAKQISNEIGIISIRPDTITFKVSRVIGKLVKVHPVIEVSFAREYILQKPPTANPVSVMVHGPVEILDTLQDIYTNPIELKNLSQTAVRDASLILPPELKSESEKVSVIIAVEQFTEAKFEIPVSIVNHPADLRIKTFPSKVKITCRVGISQYSKLNSSNFKAFIDYSNRSRILSKLPVTLGEVPENILSVDYFPKEVDYIIERKP